MSPVEIEETSTEPEMKDLAKSYHERNQKFLQETEKSRTNIKSPLTSPRHSRSQLPAHSPHHGIVLPKRNLRSIKDDDWSEDGVQDDDIKRKKQRDRRPNMNEIIPLENKLTSRLATIATSNVRDMESYDQPSYVSSDSDDSDGSSGETESAISEGRETTSSAESSYDKQYERRKSRTSSSTNTNHADRSLNVEDRNESSGSPPSEEVSENRHHKKRSRRYQQDKKFIKRYFKTLESERQILIDQWKKEFDEEQRQRQSNPWAEDFAAVKRKISSCLDSFWAFLAFAEVFISNMPLTIGAVGLSWVTQGVIWFKFMEENIDACTTVHFRSPHCIYPEFPGCFECDTSNSIYKFAVTFHYFCHCVAATCCLLFLTKCVLAWRVVADELSNPTTSTPCGVVCITMICVAAGRGLVGEIVVLTTSVFHLLLSFWFLYMAIYKFQLWPDPGWHPNTVGLAYACIKTWLYFPTPGRILMVICMTYFFSTFFIGCYRAFYNHKIAAPVCFISLSAPSITMYAMTIMAQPSYEQELFLEASPAAETRFETWHKANYLPVQHFMMILSLLGFVSSLHCLWVRWPQFRLKEFSPAHVAFVFPILSHTNAVQAYRAGYNSFSNEPDHTPFKIALFSYWFTCLVCGTIINLIFTYKYVVRLPRWTKTDTTDLEDEEAPPSPSHTIVRELIESHQGGTHECMRQTFASPAVLHANEAGALIRVRRGTEEFDRLGPYVRTRQVDALGFDLTMTEEELMAERAALLDRVARTAPRTRNRTVSIPAMMTLKGRDGRGIYGTFRGEDSSDDENQDSEDGRGRHRRADTLGTWV